MNAEDVLTETLTLLRDVCPELTWTCWADTIRAEGTAIVVKGSPPRLERDDDSGAGATPLPGMARWEIRQTVLDLLLQEEIDELPNGALFEARVDLNAANDELTQANARAARARVEYEDAMRALDIAEQRTSRAEGAVWRLERTALRRAQTRREVGL